MTSSLFASSNEIEGPAAERATMASAPFGERIDHLGRYKMPLLPGEAGPKSGGDWVPRGVQSATNLAGSIVDTRQLAIWERERSQMGLAKRHDLRERLSLAVNMAEMQAMKAGTDLFGAGVKIREVAPGLAEELDAIHKKAKQAAGGNAGAQAGTNRHDVWEAKAATGRLFGTPEINDQVEALEQLLADNHLRRVPGLSERTVRNVALKAAGRFDDVLQDTRTGELFMADLKTKRRQFYSWLEVRIQLAVYASAEWMLTNFSPAEIGAQDALRGQYVPGPLHYVSQDWAIILHMPADGAPPNLYPANLTKGLAAARVARQVCDMRSEAKSVAAHEEALNWSAWQAQRSPVRADAQLAIEG